MKSLPLTLAAISLACSSFLPIAAHAADAPEKVVAGAPAAAAGKPETRVQRRADHIEGHIAYLKTELMITPAQEAAWDKVADQMRGAVKDYEDTVAKLPSDDATPTAVDSLSTRAQFADMKAKAEANFLNAFKPLYDSFSDDQKKAADEVFANTENK